MATNKTACISGTDRGVGLALAKELLLAGYTVFAGGMLVTNEELGRFAERFPERLHAFQLDVGSDESVANAAAFIKSKCDKLDLLINNAAVLGDIERTIRDKLDFGEIQHVYNVTALGAIRMSNALIEPILRGGKLIVTISSEAGSIGSSHREAWFGYCMAKAALNMGSAIIHNHIREEGGRVLLIHPGWVRTYMRGALDTAGTYSPEEAAAFIMRRIEERKDELRDKPLYIEADTGKELPW